jgi:hypothetical protein
LTNQQKYDIIYTSNEREDLPMETKHFDLATSYDRTRMEALMQHLAKEIGKKHNHQVRLIEQGGGFAILPDTNCKEDILESEFAKAFHLGEISTATAPKPERISTVLTCRDFDDMFLSLTADQIKLLKWLQYNDYLCDGVEYITIGSEKFTEI